MAESEAVVTDEEEPREVQVTERYVKRRKKSRKSGERKGESASIRRSFLSGLEVAPYVAVVEIVEHPDAAERSMPTFVLNRKIITGNQVRDRGLEATQEWIAEQWDEGVGGCYALRLCNKPNFSSTMKDPDTERPFPDYTFTSGEMKVAAPHDELEGDPEDVDPYDDEIRDKGKRLRLAYLEKKIKRLEGRDEDEPRRAREDAGLSLIIPILQEALRPKPSFDVEAMKAIFSAQREANAEMQKTVVSTFGTLMQQIVKFKIDEIRDERGLQPELLPEDAPWWARAAGHVIERVAETPAGQTLAAKLGSSTAAPTPAPPPTMPTAARPALPAGNEAQMRSASLTRVFAIIAQSADMRPDPGVLVDKYLRNAFGMCHEADRVEVLGFLRRLREGDFSGLENLLQFLGSHRVPVRDFVVKMGASPQLLQWLKDVLLALLETHEPAAEATAPTGEAAPAVQTNGTGEDPGPMGTGPPQEIEAPAETEEPQ